MPLKLKIDALRAELAGARSLLEQSRSVRDIVGELQYQQRVDELTADLEELQGQQNPFASVALYFNGKPVIGSRGISAEFAGKALEGFQDIISKVYALNELGAMGQRGRVPLQRSAGLMVTGVSHGSFGFVLDEMSDQEELCNTALKDVVSSVSHILQDIGSDSDERFEGAIEGMDSRTLSSLRDFFKYMDSSEASVRFVDDEQEFTLDYDSIHRGRVRTEATEIEEDESLIRGVLRGFLPDHRKFELQEANGEIVYGTATPEAVAQFQEAVDSGAVVVGSDCAAKVLIRETRPLNRAQKTTYRLTEFVGLGRDD